MKILSRDEYLPGGATVKGLTPFRGGVIHFPSTLPSRARREGQQARSDRACCPVGSLFGVPVSPPRKAGTAHLSFTGGTEMELIFFAGFLCGWAFCALIWALSILR